MSSKSNIVVTTKSQVQAEKMATSKLHNYLTKAVAETLQENTTTLNALQASVPVFIANYYLTINNQNKPEYIENMKKIVAHLNAKSDIITFSTTKFTPCGIPVIESMANSLKANLSRKTLDSIERMKLKTEIQDWRSESLIKAPTTVNKEDAWVAQKYTAKQLDCANRGIKMELTFSQMKRLLKRKYCYYSGVELKENTCHRVTLDRKDCTKGYTVENTVACSFAVNQFKNSMTESKDLFEGQKMSSEHIKKMLSAFGKLM